MTKILDSLTKAFPASKTEIIGAGSTADLPKDPWKTFVSKTQKIILKPTVLAKLHLMEQAAKGNEFSGFGFVDIEENNLIVYEVVLLDLGTYGWTEFDPKKVLPLLDRPDNNKMKLWFHKHPVGNGIPGSHNWSSTDQKTIREEPLGGMPELIKWSASIVKTPHGWVGRIDNYLVKKTVHVDVEFAEMQAVQTAITQIKNEKKENELFYVPTKNTIIDEKSWKWNSAVTPLGGYRWTSPLFDLSEYDEADYEDELDENLINDFFYSLEDEIQLQLRSVMDEAEDLAKKSGRIASSLPKEYRGKVDFITDQINQLFGRLTVVSDQLIEQASNTKDTILEYMEE